MQSTTKLKKKLILIVIKSDINLIHFTNTCISKKYQSFKEIALKYSSNILFLYSKFSS